MLHEGTWGRKGTLIWQKDYVESLLGEHGEC